MRKIIFAIILLGTGSQLLTSCSSSCKNKGQFSKRKYLKNFKVNKYEKTDTSKFYVEQISKTNKPLLANQVVESNQLIYAETKKVYFYNDAELDETSNYDQHVSSHKQRNDCEEKRSEKIRENIVKKRKTNQSDFKNLYVPHKPKDSRKVPVSIIISLLCIFPGALFLFPILLTPFFAILGLRKISKAPKIYKGTGWGVLAISLFFILIIFVLLFFVLLFLSVLAAI